MLRVCSRAGHWARAADRAAGPPAPSSPKGWYRCQSAALRSSPLAQPLSHWHLPQTQHTTNKPLIGHSTGPISVTHHPELIRTKTQSHLQLCPSLRHQGQFLSGAFCLTALYSQLCHLPQPPTATWTLQQPPNWQPAPIPAPRLKKSQT